MILLAISGGPDSMALLNMYKKKDIFVAHVNYNKRTDSNVDQKIVEDFCKQFKIPYEILSLKTKAKGNFQKWARNQRYDFFAKLYKEHNCNKLLLAHHKDDFLETALMQQDANRKPEYFGIRKTNLLFNMNIYRPFINKYWKQDLIEYLNDCKIKYAVDSSNEEPVFTRNKKRIALKDLSFKEKSSMYNWFKMSNKILVKKTKKVNYLLKKWEKSNFSVNRFVILPYKEELVYAFVHKQSKNINLSSKKIDSIIAFIESEKGNIKYKLSDQYFINKSKGLISFLKY